MRLTLLTFFILNLLSCQTPEYPYDFPICLTNEIRNNTSESVVFTATIESLPPNQKVRRYGFFWGELNNPKGLTISNDLKDDHFTKTVRSDLWEGKIYEVRSFIETENRIVYGNAVLFTSENIFRPVITEFEPKQGASGTVVKIMGDRFSGRLNCNVVFIYLDDGRYPLHCQVLSESENSIEMKIPDTNVTGNFKIQVITEGGVAFSNGFFSLR